MVEPEIEAIDKSFVLKAEARNLEEKDTILDPVEQASLGRDRDFYAKTS